jgi:hypothetical protein
MKSIGGRERRDMTGEVGEDEKYHKTTSKQHNNQQADAQEDETRQERRKRLIETKIETISHQTAPKHSH